MMRTKKQKRVIQAVGTVAIIAIILGFILPYIGLAVKG
jgi:hypothetical protein